MNTVDSRCTVRGQMALHHRPGNYDVARLLLEDPGIIVFLGSEVRDPRKG